MSPRVSVFCPEEQEEERRKNRGRREVEMGGGDNMSWEKRESPDLL